MRVFDHAESEFATHKCVVSSANEEFVKLNPKALKIISWGFSIMLNPNLLLINALSVVQMKNFLN